jgi:NAD(P)-dependent dehydrogenase (short-subunit alcohol dehydrogenase family)
MPESDRAIKPVFMDVTDDNSVRAAVAAVLEDAGRIDIAVNCAGMGIAGPLEYVSDELTQLQFETNVFGTLRVARAVMGPMRDQGGGRIILFASVCAHISVPFQSDYCASKAAVLSYGRAINNEAKKYGIECCVIEPGDIKTGFTGARKKQPLGPDNIYADVCERAVAAMEVDEQNGPTPEKAIRSIIEKVLKKDRMPIHFVPASCSLLYRVMICPILPYRYIDNLLYKTYG